MDGGEVTWLEGIQIETFLNWGANCGKWVGWVTFDCLYRPRKFMQNSFQKSEIGPVVFKLLSGVCTSGAKIGRKSRKKLIWNDERYSQVMLTWNKGQVITYEMTVRNQKSTYYFSSNRACSVVNLGENWQKSTHFYRKKLIVRNEWDLATFGCYTFL